MLYEEKEVEYAETSEILDEKRVDGAEFGAVGIGDGVDNCEKVEEKGELIPLDCFLMKSETSEKWILKMAKLWHYIISIVWFLIGALTFAPVIYLSHKLNLVIKGKKKSVLGGTLLYAIIIATATLLLKR